MSLKAVLSCALVAKGAEVDSLMLLQHRASRAPSDAISCEQLLTTANGATSSAEEFLSFCASNGFDSDVCSKASGLLGEHPWDEEKIQQICSQNEQNSAEVGDTNASPVAPVEVSFSQTFDSAQCEQLLQAAESQASSPEEFRTFCNDKGFGSSVCDEALVLLGEHPWDQERMSKVCSQEGNFAAKAEQTESSPSSLLEAFSSEQCEELLKTAESQVTSAEEFGAFCNGKGFTPAVCDKAVALLGDHPWQEQSIHRVCSQEGDFAAHLAVAETTEIETKSEPTAEIVEVENPLCQKSCDGAALNWNAKCKKGKCSGCTICQNMGVIGEWHNPHKDIVERPDEIVKFSEQPKFDDDYADMWS